MIDIDNTSSKLYVILGWIVRIDGKNSIVVEIRILCYDDGGVVIYKGRYTIRCIQTVSCYCLTRNGLHWKDSCDPPITGDRYLRLVVVASIKRI